MSNDNNADLNDIYNLLEKNFAVITAKLEKLEQLLQHASTANEKSETGEGLSLQDMPNQNYQPKSVLLASGERDIAREKANARKDAALSLIGELSGRGDRIMIISVDTPTKIIEELIEESKDDPEITTELRKLFEKVSSGVQSSAQ